MIGFAADGGRQSTASVQSGVNDGRERRQHRGRKHGLPTAQGDHQVGPAAPGDRVAEENHPVPGEIRDGPEQVLAQFGAGRRPRTV